jgi:hypothetical protein
LPESARELVTWPPLVGIQRGKKRKEGRPFVAYIPADAKWYLAEIVLQITVDGDPCNVVHTNLVLVRADLPEEAYQKATALGVDAETSYNNPDGKHVSIRFRGLHDLNVIHDKLEHGAEIIFSEDLSMDEATIRKWVSAKEELGIFRPIVWAKAPNYCSGEVMNDLYQKFPDLKPANRSTPEIDE